MPELPSVPELKRLRKVLLTHAIGTQAHRQRQAMEYIFARIIDEGEECQTIEPSEIMDLPLLPGEKAAKDEKGAASGLKREIGEALDVFYGEASHNGEPSVAHKEAQQLNHRVGFKERGNFMLQFPSYSPRRQAPELIPVFWRPHLPPQGMAKTLYPEPIFLIDERQTYFRNPAVGTGPNESALSYLSIPGPLKTGYSYVPSGIVQSLLLLSKTLRPYDKNRPEFFACEAVKPYSSLPSGSEDLILLATPSSTDLVGTIQGGEKMLVDAKGVHFAGNVHDDDDATKWGVVTRTLESHRIITMLAAKHGRSIEAIMKYLVRPDKLAELAQRLGGASNFPATFQIMFRMPSHNTREGPHMKDAFVHAIHPDPEQRTSPAPSSSAIQPA